MMKPINNARLNIMVSVLEYEYLHVIQVLCVCFVQHPDSITGVNAVIDTDVVLGLNGCA